MNTEVLRVLRNIFLRMFAIGFLLLILVAGLTYLNWETAVQILTVKLNLVNREALGTIILNAILWIRFFVVFLLLVPALALHWTLCAKKQ